MFQGSSTRLSIPLYRRLFSAPSLFAMLLFFSALVVEFRYNLIEHIAGAYLSWHNSERKKLGRIWEHDIKANKAREVINQYVAENESEEHAATTYNNLAELISFISRKEVASLSAEQFTNLYLTIPPEERSKLLTPQEAFRLRHFSNWYRTFVSLSNNEVQLIFVDTSNLILREVNIDFDTFANLQSSFDKVLKGRLEAFSTFRNRLYSREVYFSGIYRLPEDATASFLNHASDFLKWGKNFTRVGIADVADNGTIEVAYEVKNKKGKYRLYVESLKDHYILDLIYYLDTEATANLLDDAR